MMKGIVTAIFTVEAAGAPVVSMEAAHAVPGLGLEGDRYFYKVGTWSKRSNHDREVTLIEAEALERLKTELNIELAPGEHRRNIVTEGISLIDLVGREFSVGAVKMLGVRSCEPCRYLEEITGKKGLLKGLLHSGLRAKIVTEGMVAVGDIVEVAQTKQSE